MKLCSYRGERGAPRAGVVVDRNGSSAVIDVEQASAGELPASMLDLLELGPKALQKAERMAAARSATGTPLGSLSLLQPVIRPPKLLAAAANYQEHIDEGGGTRVDRRRAVPKLFLKPSSALLAPGAALELPSISSTVDWELELAVVIGQRGKNVRENQALDLVAGYSIINDISARTVDWGVERDAPEASWFFDWLNGKWPDGFAPMGPWLVTPDEAGDPQQLGIELKVNGKVWQSATTADMIFGVAELIAFASRFMTLEPGDVIATGTPSGTGDAASTYLKRGDVMVGRIERLGELRTPVA